jgi:hypothetical protein
MDDFLPYMFWPTVSVVMSLAIIVTVVSITWVLLEPIEKVALCIGWLIWDIIKTSLGDLRAVCRAVYRWSWTVLLGLAVMVLVLILAAIPLFVLRVVAP